MAEELNLPIIDFYEVSCENKELLLEDKVHFAEEGYTKLGEYLVKEIDKILV